MRRVIPLAAMLAFLAGCESVERLPDIKGAPSATKGYIAGSFSGEVPRFGDGAHYAFIFKEVKSGRQYMLPFFDPLDSGEQSDKLKLVEVPPGRYVFSHWTSYKMSTGETLAESRQAPGGLGTIDVAPSRVTFIGGFKADDHFSSLRKSLYVITPVPTQMTSIAQRLQAEYPGYVLLTQP